MSKKEDLVMVATRVEAQFARRLEVAAQQECRSVAGLLRHLLLREFGATPTALSDR
jgi:hypothetical protein